MRAVQHQSRVHTAAGSLSLLSFKSQLDEALSQPTALQERLDQNPEVPSSRHPTQAADVQPEQLSPGRPELGSCGRQRKGSGLLLTDVAQHFAQCHVDNARSVEKR